MTVAVNVKRELCQAKSVLLCLSVGKTAHLHNTAKTRSRYTRRHGLRARVIVSPPYKSRVFRRWSPESPMRPASQGQRSRSRSRTPCTALCAESGSSSTTRGCKIFVDRQRVVPALQKLVERRLLLPCTFWSIGSKVLIMLDNGLGLTRRLNLKKRRARAINL